MQLCVVHRAFSLRSASCHVPAEREHTLGMPPCMGLVDRHRGMRPCLVHLAAPLHTCCRQSVSKGEACSCVRWIVLFPEYLLAATCWRSVSRGACCHACSHAWWIVLFPAYLQAATCRLALCAARSGLPWAPCSPLGRIALAWVLQLLTGKRHRPPGQPPVPPPVPPPAPQTLAAAVTCRSFTRAPPGTAPLG